MKNPRSTNDSVMIRRKLCACARLLLALAFGAAVSATFGCTSYKLIGPSDALMPSDQASESPLTAGIFDDGVHQKERIELLIEKLIQTKVFSKVDFLDSLDEKPDVVVMLRKTRYGFNLYPQSPIDMIFASGTIDHGYELELQIPDTDRRSAVDAFVTSRFIMGLAAIPVNLAPMWTVAPLENRKDYIPFLRKRVLEGLHRLSQPGTAVGEDARRNPS